MALKPLHVWKLDADGNPKLDRHGFRIEHPKMGKAKTRKEMSDAEREHYDQQLADTADQRRRLAARVLQPIQKAQQVLES